MTREERLAAFIAALPENIQARGASLAEYYGAPEGMSGGIGLCAAEANDYETRHKVAAVLKNPDPKRRTFQAIIMSERPIDFGILLRVSCKEGMMDNFKVRMGSCRSFIAHSHTKPASYGPPGQTFSSEILNFGYGTVLDTWAATLGGSVTKKIRDRLTAEERGTRVMCAEIEVDDDPEAMAIFSMIQQGRIRSGSCGFTVHDVEKSCDEQDGLPIFDVTKWSLGEWSVCGEGRNDGCFVQAGQVARDAMKAAADGEKGFNAAIGAYAGKQQGAAIMRKMFLAAHGAALRNRAGEADGGGGGGGGTESPPKTAAENGNGNDKTVQASAAATVDFDSLPPDVQKRLLAEAGKKQEASASEKRKEADRLKTELRAEMQDGVRGELLAAENTRIAEIGEVLEGNYGKKLEAASADAFNKIKEEALKPFADVKAAAVEKSVSDALINALTEDTSKRGSADTAPAPTVIRGGTGVESRFLGNGSGSPLKLRASHEKGSEQVGLVLRALQRGEGADKPEVAPVLNAMQADFDANKEAMGFAYSKHRASGGGTMPGLRASGAGGPADMFLGKWFFEGELSGDLRAEMEREHGEPLRRNAGLIDRGLRAAVDSPSISETKEQPIYTTERWFWSMLVLDMLGMDYVPIHGEMRFPFENSVPQAEEIADSEARPSSGTLFTDQTMTVMAEEATPKMLASKMDINILPQLLEDRKYGIAANAMMNMVLSIRRKQEQVAINGGGGTGKVRGLLQWPGVTTSIAYIDALGALVDSSGAVDTTDADNNIYVKARAADTDEGSPARALGKLAEVLDVWDILHIRQQMSSVAIRKMKSRVSSKNALRMGNNGFLTHPKLEAMLSERPWKGDDPHAGNGTVGFIPNEKMWMGEEGMGYGRLMRTRAFCTTEVPTDKTKLGQSANSKETIVPLAYSGKWSDCKFCSWQALRIRDWFNPDLVTDRTVAWAFWDFLVLRTTPFQFREGDIVTGY